MNQSEGLFEGHDANSKAGLHTAVTTGQNIAISFTAM